MVDVAIFTAFECLASQNQAKTIILSFTPVWVMTVASLLSVKWEKSKVRSAIVLYPMACMVGLAIFTSFECLASQNLERTVALFFTPAWVVNAA